MYDDDGNYVVLPDPAVLPDPYFEGLTWEQICGELDHLEREAWAEYAMYEMEQEFYRDQF